MILTGFDIQNWACIKCVSVADVPPTGVIVLHGPNRTGKSSIVHALRACLMDYQSDSTAQALKSRFPRGVSDKPTVSVTFRADGASYRITKEFGTRKSKFESLTTEGAWKVETTSCAGAHERTCGLVGSDDSAKGLHQLLWLTQAEFHLPDAKKFDASVQAQLRGILGVLQTSLDDRFIGRVKERWNTWHSGQRKSGKQHTIKDGCNLAENRRKLAASQEELQESEDKFNQVEELLRQTAKLMERKDDLERQLREQACVLRQLREERDRSQRRIDARQQAEKDHVGAEKELKAAQEEEKHRADAANRCDDGEDGIEPVSNKVEAIGRRIKSAEDEQSRRRHNVETARSARRDLQDRADQVADRIRVLGLANQVNAAQGDYEKAQGIARDIADIENFLDNHPAPDDATVTALKDNRQKVSRLEAERDAAAMTLTLSPDPEARAARLALDGGPPRDAAAAGEPASHAIRRKAVLHISGWGRIEFSRGTDSTNLDQIEDALRQCNEEFANAVTLLGISATDPQALGLVLERKAEHSLRTPELNKKRKELKKQAPQGLNSLHSQVVELQTKLRDVPAADSDDAESLPADPNELDKLAESLRLQIASKDRDVETLQVLIAQEQDRLQNERGKETELKEELAGLNATAKSRREELARLRTEEQIAERVRLAIGGLEDARVQLEQTALTNEEQTVGDRLKAVDEAVKALEQQIDDTTSKQDIIKGRLVESEGLHAHRAAVAARVEELARLAEREELERDGVDRLYALFEECREKQLGTLMGPIHDRVLNWMRVLDLGDYKEVRFNDAFLPERLMTRDGTGEFTMDEESTGAQEQIAMLVRLALGSILSSVDKPAVAILDDPLTHCDVGRLNKMRVILRRAAEGDPLMSPPAGPLQILIFTCHPEWFRDERATVIDLENPEVMSHWKV